jgi:type VI secretion system secreted protein Hcp
MADLDLFLKLDGIEGEVQDVKHKGELRIEGFSGAVNHAIIGAAGQDAGLSTWHDANFTMQMDKAYPKLFQACTI